MRLAISNTRRRYVDTNREPCGAIAISTVSLAKDLISIKCPTGCSHRRDGFRHASLFPLSGITLRALSFELTYQPCGSDVYPFTSAGKGPAQSTQWPSVGLRRREELPHRGLRNRAFFAAPFQQM